MPTKSNAHYPTQRLPARSTVGHFTYNPWNTRHLPLKLFIW